MNQTRLKLGKRLKEARIASELKQEHAARYLRVPTSAVSNMESGRRSVEAWELYYLSELYGKPVNWFFDEQPNEVDPLLREALQLLENTPATLRNRALSGLIGFLKS